MNRVYKDVQDATAADSGSSTAGKGPDAADPPAAVSAEERQRMIAAAAYRRYERRAGAPGDPLTDWLEAEQEVDRSLRQQRADFAEQAAAAKRAFARGLATLLAESQVQLEGLASRAMAANAAVRRKYEEQRQVAAAKYEAAHGKLAEIHQHADGAWGHLKDGAERAAAEMSVAVRQLASLFSRH